MSAVPACAAPGVYQLYKPRRPQASPLFRLVSEHFRAFHAAYDERFAATYGDWRPVVREVADKFLECGVLEHGFARVRCAACTHEYLLAFSCKARYFCPSCHAKRLALWTQWLEESLLVSDVPHRQGRAHDSEAAPRVVPLPPLPPRRSRARRGAHRYRGGADAHRGAHQAVRNR